MKKTLLFMLANVLGYAALLSELAAQKNRETLCALLTPPWRQGFG